MTARVILWLYSTLYDFKSIFIVYGSLLWKCSFLEVLFYNGVLQILLFLCLSQNFEVYITLSSAAMCIWAWLIMRLWETYVRKHSAYSFCSQNNLSVSWIVSPFTYEFTQWMLINRFFGPVIQEMLMYILWYFTFNCILNELHAKLTVSCTTVYMELIIVWINKLAKTKH